ncbi:MAG TPA: response regulator [Gemmatimonadales bacterium]|nr:response regulator [Gemmatimonadales bacterium]
MQHSVLIVDDDAPFRAHLERALTPLSYRVLTAADAQTAYALLASDPVEAVLLEVDLPVMSGFGLYLAMLHRCPNLEHHIAIMTAHPGAVLRPWLRRHGCPVFRKPFPVQELTAWLETATAAPEQEAAG